MRDAINVYYQRFLSSRQKIRMHPLTPIFNIIQLQQPRPLPSPQPHFKKLTENKSKTSRAHLNVQALIALMSTFNEFSLMLDEGQFDVTILRETWLKDYIYQQNYVQINSYNAILKIKPIREVVE